MAATTQGSAFSTGTGGVNTLVASSAVSLSIVTPTASSEICLTDTELITPQPITGAMPVATRNLIVKGKCAAEAAVTINGANAAVSGNDWRACVPIVQLGELKIAAASGSVTITNIVTIYEFQFIQPTMNQQFAIPANPNPSMPEISASVKIVGLNPDPTESTAFTWELIIGGYYRDRSGWQQYSYQYTGQTQGAAPWKPAFNKVIVGGWGRLQVKSQIGGKEVKSDFRWIDINGENPSSAIVQQYIQTNGGTDVDILHKIIHYESYKHQYLQFFSTAETREPNDNRIPSAFTAGSSSGGPPRPLRPVYGAPPAGIGIAQLDPASFPDQHWNWQSNVLSACQLYYKEKVPIATHIYKIEQSRLDNLRTDVLSIVNLARSKQTPPQSALSLSTIQISAQKPFSAAELRRAKIRTYNGGYNYRLDYTYQLSQDILTATLVGTGSWVEDPGVNYSQSVTTVTVAGKQLTLHKFSWQDLKAARLPYVKNVEALQ